MMDTNPPATLPPPRSRRDRLLLRAARITIILGVGVSAMLTILASGPDRVHATPPKSVAMDLIQNIRDICQDLKFADPADPQHFGPEKGETLALFDDVDDLNGITFLPPIDGRRRPSLQHRGWAQFVQVRNVDPDHLTRVVPGGTSKVKRITVKALHQGVEVAEASWLVFDLPH